MKLISWNINRRRDVIVAEYYIGLNPEFIEGKIRTLVGARYTTYSRDSYYERTVTNPEVDPQNFLVSLGLKF